MVKDIAQRQHCSAAAVSLSWAVQRGISIIPKSANKQRIEENIRTVVLSEEEMKLLNSAHQTFGNCRIADYIPQLQIEIDGKQTINGWSKVDLGWEDAQGNWLL